jgi:phage terminase large subunit-like protein
VEPYSESDRKALEEGAYFDEAQADKAVRFIETYAIPSTVGKPIKLIPWQRDIVRRLYGWRLKDGRRRFKKVIISTAKKNGKTLLQSGILLYELAGNTTPSPFVVSASTTRENAGQVYRELAFSIRNNDKLNAICRCLDSYKEIRAKQKNARYKAFSADAGGAEGENISALLVDELHAHVSDRLYRALEYATIARPDGFTAIVSTAGRDQSTLWFDLFRYAQGVQDGSIIDTSVLPYICTAPLEADIEDPAVWRQANPSLDVAFSEDDFRRDLDRAKQEGTAGLLSFRRYRLNQWCQAEDAFIDPAKFDLCLSPMSDEQLKGFPLFVGCDLSQTTDPCAVSCVWALPDRRFYLRSHGWVCQEGVKRREETNLPKYEAYKADGHFTITSGTANDYRAIRSHLMELRRAFNLKEVVFDQYNALEMTAELMAEGITVYRQPQNHKHYTAPVKEFEIALTEGRVKHDGNKALRWALSNTRLDVDTYGNAKPSREKSTDKIDLSIATLMAFGRAVCENVNAQHRRSVYDERPILAF